MSNHDNACEVMLTPQDMNRLGLCLCKERALKARLAEAEAAAKTWENEAERRSRRYEQAAVRLAEAERLLRAALPHIRHQARCPKQGDQCCNCGAAQTYTDIDFALDDWRPADSAPAVPDPRCVICGHLEKDHVPYEGQTVCPDTVPTVTVTPDSEDASHE